MERGNGLISHNDLKAYQSVYREPVIGTFKGLEVISMGPPSQGTFIDSYAKCYREFSNRYSRLEFN